MRHICTDFLFYFFFLLLLFSFQSQLKISHEEGKSFDARLRRMVWKLSSSHTLFFWFFFCPSFFSLLQVFHDLNGISWAWSRLWKEQTWYMGTASITVRSSSLLFRARTKKKKKKKKYSDPWIWEQQIRTESRKKSRIVISWREHNCQEVSHSTDMLHPATCKLTVEGHTVSFWILKKDVIFFILFSWRAYSFIQLLCVNSWWKYLGYHFESYFYAVLSSSS